jgi:hypothetical protein
MVDTHKNSRHDIFHSADNTHENHANWLFVYDIMPFSSFTKFRQRTICTILPFLALICRLLTRFPVNNICCEKNNLQSLVDLDLRGLISQTSLATRSLSVRSEYLCALLILKSSEPSAPFTELLK